MKLNEIAQLVKLIDKSSLTELSYSYENVKIVLKKGSGMTMTSYAPNSQPYFQQYQAAPASGSVPPGVIGEEGDNSVSQDSAKNGFKEITSPMVGTFYASPSPGSELFVTVGSSVKPGQTLCVIEAMKLMNEIESDVAGVVEEICVKNESAVEFGSILFRIRPS